jgi:hypothetical protein
VKHLARRIPSYHAAVRRRAWVLFVLAVVGCTPARREPPPTTSAPPPAPSAPAGAPITPPAPAAPAPPPAKAAPSEPERVELPREVAPGSGSEGDAPEKRGSCTADRDCRAFSHYCEGCFCVPLAKSASDLKCKGAHTACFVDPCRTKRAVCRKGTCALADEAEK